MATREREEMGLSSWPMTKSYPETQTQIEARKIVKYITSQRKDTEVILQNDTPKEQRPDNSEKSLKDRLLGFAHFFASPQPDKDPPDVDEVDGLAEDLLKPLVKLVFLKILLVDIGISVGDVITDLLQGLSLVFDADWNVQWSTYHYGVGVLSIMWLPGLVVLLHQATGEATFRLFSQSNHWGVTFGLGIIFFLLFPLVPTALYLRVLLTKQRFRTAQQKLVFLRSEANSHEIKAIAGSLESPLELILLLWLMLRGILQLPWDRPLTSNCVGDSLGRVACLPSLPMASIIFSLLSILKTLCDLNISPIVSSTNHPNSIPKLGFTCHLIARFCPMFVCNVLFRTAAFSFIITYLDYWALIPGIMVFLLCLAHTTLISQNHSTEETWPVENEGPEAIQRDTRSSCSQDEEAISNRTTPILLNSLLGLLLPIAYSPLTSEPPITRKLEFLVKSLAERQAAILRSQSLLVNTCTMSVVIVIYCLVTYTSTFNYWSNILTPWWFTVAFLYLLLLYLLTLMLPWIPGLPLVNKHVQETSTHSITRHRHLTGDSNCHSVHSASSNLVKEEQGPTDLCMKISISLLLIMLIIGPSVAGIVLFKALGDDDLHLMQTKEGEDGLLHNHFTHLTSLNPNWNGNQLENFAFSGCENLDNLEGSLLLMNMSLPACRSLYRRLTTSTFPSQPPRSIVILEDLPISRWRLSSPPQYMTLGPSLPVFRAFAQDWSQGWTAAQAAVVKGQKQDAENNLSCSRGSEIHIGTAGQDKGCSRKKFLHEDGKITETRCVKTSCMKQGLPCQPDTINKVHAECHSHLHAPMFKNTKNDILPSLKFKFKSTVESNICCTSSTEHLKYFGPGCKSLLINYWKPPVCDFSRQYSLYPCNPNGNRQENSSFCKYPGKDCVVMISFLSFCNKTSPLACDIQDLSCELVNEIY